MVEASYMGNSASVKLDKQQEKTLIYLIAVVVLFIIAYVLYKGISAAEAVTKPVSEIFETGTDAVTGTLKTVTGIGATIVSTGVAVKEVAEAAYAAPKQMYDEAVAGVDKNFNLPQGTYDSYLDSLGVFGIAAKAGTSLLGDSVINTVIQAGQNTRSWFDSIF